MMAVETCSCGARFEQQTASNSELRDRCSEFREAHAACRKPPVPPPVAPRWIPPEPWTFPQTVWCGTVAGEDDGMLVNRGA